jgi:hypothetical protein
MILDSYEHKPPAYKCTNAMHDLALIKLIICSLRGYMKFLTVIRNRHISNYTSSTVIFNKTLI